MRVRLTGLHAFDSCQLWYRYFHFIYEERAPGCFMYVKVIYNYRAFWITVTVHKCLLIYNDVR